MTDPVQIATPGTHSLSPENLKNIIDLIFQQKGSNPQPYSSSPGNSQRDNALGSLGVINPILLGHAARTQLLNRFYSNDFSLTYGNDLARKLGQIHGQALQLQDIFKEIPFDIFTDFLSITKPHIEELVKTLSPQEKKSYESFIKDFTGESKFMPSYQNIENITPSKEGQI